MKKTIMAAGVLALLGATAANAEHYGGPEYQDPGYGGAYGGSYSGSYNYGSSHSGSTKVDWAGLYVGGSFGKTWGKADTNLKNGTGQTMVRKSVEPDSFMWGGYVGYNFQTTNDMVLGIETDFLWNTDGESGNRLYIPDPNNPGNVYNYKASVKQKWNGATRIRVGWIKGKDDRFLPYIAGGISYASIRAGAGTYETSAAANSDNKTNSKTHTGWNIGAGVEYVPPIMNDHLILRAEYRYTDFGDGSFNKGNYNHANQAPSSGRQRVDYKQNDIRFGIAYKF